MDYYFKYKIQSKSEAIYLYNLLKKENQNVEHFYKFIIGFDLICCVDCRWLIAIKNGNFWYVSHADLTENRKEITKAELIQLIKNSLPF